MKKKKLLLIISIFIIIIGICLVLIFGKDSNIIEKIASSNIFAKSSTSTEELQKAENGILPIKISYSDLSIEAKVSKIVQISDTVQETAVSKRNEKMAKVEVHRKKVENTDVEVIYDLVVSNKGNASAKVDKIITNIFDNLRLAQSSKANWDRIGEYTYLCDNFGTVEAGESKTIQMALIGQATDLMGENHLETMLISSEEADQRVVEQDEDIEITEKNVKQIMGDTNNYSSASLIVSINTRLRDYSILALIILAVLIVIAKIIKKFIKKRETV